MTTPKQNYVQFMSQANLEAQQKLAKGYYQQLIRMYGVTVKYFRKNYEFFDPNGLLNQTGNVDWTYGYDSDYTYGNESEMIGYIEMGNDAFIFSMIGADAEQDGKIFFTKEQFELDMLETVGVVTSGALSASGYVSMDDYSGLYEQEVDFGPFDMTLSANIDVDNSGIYDEIVPLAVEDIHTKVNDDIDGYKEYVHNWIVQGSVTARVTGTLDANGDGALTVMPSGDLTYNRPPNATESNGWGVAPQVGDFIRITFGDGTTEDYTFTKVTDRDLQNDGISPFLGKFVWKCDFTRKKFSHEDVPSGSIAREQEENDFLNDVITIQDDKSDDHYDYDVETDADDDVYGGF
jgi:hypothetical protein